ncbi:hypothetical protein PQQ52_31990 [Paraburkholderia sediminicola]|uniref:hypothetical protein n=1 Tax=Paraburkholderia sediminicola TaxID=458836 RepID=UPI0038BBE875
MSTAAEGTGIAMLIAVAALIIVCIAMVSMARAVCFIVSSRDGRSQRAQQMIKVSLKRTVVGAVATAVLVFAWSYWDCARLRSLVRPADCDSVQSADGRYTARSCYLGSEIILQLYEGSSERLVAERTYGDHSHDPVRLYWKDGALQYEDGDELRTITLPPSIYDRLLAKLP